MEQVIQHFFRTNKWAIVLGVVTFIFCVLVAFFSIGPALIILLLTVIAGGLGYMKDRGLTFEKLIRSFK